MSIQPNSLPTRQAGRAWPCARRSSGPWQGLSPLLLGLCGLCLTSGTLAAEVRVAVAANFALPMQQIVAEFERSTGHRAGVSLGGTGKLFAQISHGAPFEVFLAADQRAPARLVAEGKALADSRFTYARGRLVLWSSQPDLLDADASALQQGRFSRLAIANPRVAPYGAAALAVLEGLGLLEMVRPKLVQGENIAQTYQFVASGNAELGFVARSQVMRDGQLQAGSAWPVPERLHPPLRQDAVLLLRGKDNPAARALLAFLRSEAAGSIIQSFGYGL
ncbi:molybdate ABC transporter substrate-binding protein [Magnetovirga frankeli]|nr:molybdate ABC transporter substrate-binding protein [gamma proteobacterium SS-5]